jgi:uncharacterized protein YkwD
MLESLADYRTSSQIILKQPIPTPTPRAFPSESPQAYVPPFVKDTTPEDNQVPWGVPEKVDDVTYTIRVGYDERMSSPQELFDALNQYRAVHERHSLAWDDRLASYAQGRADHFKQTQNTDKHEGFNSFLENEDGFNKLGFNRLGENSYYGGQLTGTHLIEWVFAKSPGHDANQLDPGWTHVGIGTTDASANLIFGSGKF